MKQKINRCDVFLAAALLIISGAAYVLCGMGRQEKGSYVEITIDGEVYETCPLNVDREIVIEKAEGQNTIVIQDGKVYMADADCPDRYCVFQGKISKEKQTIVCLPHRLTAEVKSGEGMSAVDDVDAIVTVRPGLCTPRQSP